jgi:hypothetical protein
MMEGKYLLRVKKYNKSIEIQVHRGDYWGDKDSLIMKKNDLVTTNPNSIKMLKITDLKVEPSGNKHIVNI